MFSLQDLIEEKKVETLSSEWTKYSTNLFELDRTASRLHNIKKLKIIIYTTVKHDLTEIEEQPGGQRVV